MLSKNMKSILIITILFVMSFVSVNLYADCDMAAMLAKTGYSISTIAEGSGDYNDPDEFIQFLIDFSSYSYNHDGYGVTYIGDNGYFPYINTTSLSTEFYSDQAWYVTAQNITSDTYYYDYFYNNIHWYTGPMEAARDAIKLDVNDVAMVLGHDRRSDTALGNHPFRFNYGSSTFQFMHNGGIDDDIKLALYTELGGASWFSSTNHPSNWNTNTTQYNQFIDSEILFHWIMSNIMDNNGDVLLGIQDALTATVDDIVLQDEFSNPYYDYYWHNVVNFVLTDGETLYLFRNGGNSWNHHLLSWQENDNNSYTVKTQTELENSLSQFDLVEISRDQEPIVHNNFFDLDIKVFASSVTWTSFPRLTEQGTFNGEIFEQAYWNPLAQTPGLLQETENGLPTITDFDIMYGNRIPEAYIDYENLVFEDYGFDNMLFRHEGYKIQVTEGADPTVLIVDGDRLPVDHVIAESMVSGEYHWLGFWLPGTQYMIESFGDYWQYVDKVKSEEWFYSPAIVQRGDDPTYPIALSAENLTLSYGKGYMVLFKDLPQPITDFHWTVSAIAEEPEKKAEPENFTYTEKADYEAIDVFNIPPNVTEIGVFEDEVCVGAVVVEDTCAQILVYSDYANRDPIPFTLEVVTGRGFSTPIKNYKVMNMETGKYESRSIISGRQEYSVLRFGNEEEPEDNTILTPQLYGNYPNPFNPTTTISFSLPTEQYIELSIYNIKGQKVETLYSGIAEEGKHSMIWDGKDTNNKLVSSGIYFYKLKTNNKELTRKMLMMK